MTQSQNSSYGPGETSLAQGNCYCSSYVLYEMITFFFSLQHVVLLYFFDQLFAALGRDIPLRIATVFTGPVATRHTLR
jgi:hypothetical protein